MRSRVLNRREMEGEGGSVDGRLEIRSVSDIYRNLHGDTFILTGYSAFR